MQLIKTLTSPDGATKYIFLLDDESCVESVLFRQSNGANLCVSSQVGCSIGCLYCASGTLQFKRNLEIQEILDQVNNILAINSIDGEIKILFMGVGEPLLNYGNVSKAIEKLTEVAAEISLQEIIVCTSGISPNIKRMADDMLPNRLAVSIGSANEKLRRKLIPTSKQYDLQSLITATRYYYERTRKPVIYLNIHSFQR